MPACLYLHGFLSSPRSQKARQLMAYYQQNLNLDRLRVPALPFEPKQAVDLAEQELGWLMQQYEQVYLIGSSLGGYYATWLSELYQIPAVLINPAVRPFVMFANYLGPNTHFYTGETHELTTTHVQQLEAINVDELQRPEHYLLLLQTADETLDYRQAGLFYQACPAWLEGGGNHSFVGFIERMPQILSHVRRCYG